MVAIRGSTATTTYLWDPSGKLPLLLDDGTRRYIWGLGGKLAYSVAVTDTTDLWVYHRDGLGSVRAVTDANRNLVETTRTDAYGDDEVESGAVRQSFSFTGEQRDTETGLQYHQARYYDPVIGRFFSRDTVDGDRAQPGTLNRYAYGLNDPTRFADPSGYWVTDGNGGWWPEESDRGLSIGFKVGAQGGSVSWQAFSFESDNSSQEGLQGYQFSFNGQIEADFEELEQTSKCAGCGFGGRAYAIVTTPRGYGLFWVHHQMGPIPTEMWEYIEGPREFPVTCDASFCVYTLIIPPASRVARTKRSAWVAVHFVTVVVRGAVDSNRGRPLSAVTVKWWTDDPYRTVGLHVSVRGGNPPVVPPDARGPW